MTFMTSLTYDWQMPEKEKDIKPSKSGHGQQNHLIHNLINPCLADAGEDEKRHQTVLNWYGQQHNLIHNPLGND